MATPLNPVLQNLRRAEVISDPAVRELYFGSTDTPGLINQATRAAQKAFLDQPAILQETAGLSAQEQRARQLAQQGIGSYQPFLDRQRGLIEQGISDLGTQRGLLEESLGGYRSAYDMQQPYLGQAEQRFGASYGAQQPYFGQAEQQLGSGLSSLFGSLGYGGPSARQLLGQSLQGYDPRMAGQFYNPFEQQVVDQTIQDVLKAGEMQDIQQRASDISRGGESAFGSRARLTAQERQESLGRGLGDVLSKIRSGGFETAQQRALQELENRRAGARSGATLEAGFGAQGSEAQRQYAQDLLGLGQGRSAAERQYGQDLLNISGTRGELQRQLAGDISGVGTGIAGIGAGLAGYGSSLGQLGETQQRLRGQDISLLEGLGQTERDIEQQRLDRQYAQQQATRMAPTQAASYIQGFAPKYQSGQTQINKQYGLPIDPLQYGLSTALGTYSTLYNQPQAQQGTTTTTNQDNTNSNTVTTGQNYNLGPNFQPYYTPGANPQQGINSILQNPYSPPLNPYQPGQINTNLARVQPDGFIAY
jgi:hypothetical protein